VAEELRKQNGAWQVSRFRHPDETFNHWLKNECTTKNFPLPYSLLRNIFLWTFKNVYWDLMSGRTHIGGYVEWLGKYHVWC